MTTKDRSNTMTIDTVEGEHFFIISAISLLQTSFVYKKILPIMKL